MKKGIVFIFIILLNSIFLLGQNTDTVPISSTAKVSKGRTEVEFAIVGAGLSRMRKAKHFSHGFGIGIFKYANIILYTNDRDYYDFTEKSAGFINHLGFDFLKVRYSIRKRLFKNFDIDISAFSSYSSTPGDDGGNFLIGYGIESAIYYFKFNRIRFSTSIFLTKSYLDKNYYLQLIPLKVILLIKQK